jgi:hypothetical protein
MVGEIFRPAKFSRHFQVRKKALCAACAFFGARQGFFQGNSATPAGPRRTLFEPCTGVAAAIAGALCGPADSRPKILGADSRKAGQSGGQGFL